VDAVPKFIVGADADVWASSVRRARTAPAGVARPPTRAASASGALVARRILLTVVRKRSLLDGDATPGRLGRSGGPQAG
jgi:hypothetical protein